MRCKQNTLAVRRISIKADHVRNLPLFAGCRKPPWPIPGSMSADDSIIAAYALTALLVGGLVVVSWLRARRVKQALANQETAQRP